MSLTARRSLVVVVALALLGGAAAWDHKLQGEATAAGATAAAAHATNAAKAVVTGLQTAPRLELVSEASRAAALPILRTLYTEALGSDGTLQDFIDSEESWAPFREHSASTGLYLGTTLLAGSGTQPQSDAATAIRDLPMGTPPPSSGFVVEGDAVVLVAAAKVAVATPGNAPAIVVLSRRVDEAMLSAAAHNVDGRAAIAIAGKFVMAATPEVKQVLTAWHAGPRTASPELAVGWSALIPEAGVFVHVTEDARPFVSEKLATLRSTRPMLYGGAALLAALVAVLLGRKAAAAPQADAAAPALAELTAARAQLEQSQAELLRLSQRFPQMATGVAKPITDPNANAIDSTVQSAQTSRYQNIGLLGSGGMAQVFVAQTKGAEGFRRLFVVKRLKPELVTHTEMVNQFIDEARLGASMVHSNIVPVFDFGRDEEGYYLAQEYILGRDIAALVEASITKLGAPLEPGVVVTLTLEALKALGYAHTKLDDAGRPMALVHRDVSPSNLMVSAQGELKLLDFGIVKADNRATQTQAGVVKGNVFFMSPEQARGLPVDGRSDLFSLGMVMFFALTGRTLYSGESNYDLLIRAAEGPRPGDLERLYNVPAPLAELVKRAIDPDPDRRFSTAGEFVAALQGLPAAPASEIQALMISLFRDELQAERDRFSGATA